jgi:hypothetical protein
MKVVIAMLVIVFGLYAFAVNAETVSDNYIRVVDISYDACKDMHNYKKSLDEMIVPKYMGGSYTRSYEEVIGYKREYLQDRKQLRVRTQKENKVIDKTIFKNIKETLDLDNWEAQNEFKKNKLGEKIAGELLIEEKK